MDDGSGDWGVALDGRRLKTPKRVPLAVPSKSLAMAVAAEWEWQSGRSVRPFTMPLMALVATAVDQMSQPEVRDLHVRKLLEHFHADVVLCRAEPGALADHQASAHEPILRWARAEEDFQIAEWGLVEGGHDVDQADIAVRLSAPRAMLSLLRMG